MAFLSINCWGNGPHEDHGVFSLLGREHSWNDPAFIRSVIIVNGAGLGIKFSLDITVWISSETSPGNVG